MKQITMLRELNVAAMSKQSVFCPTSTGLLSPRKPLPAAFVMNMTGHMILRFIQSGLFVYTKPKK